MERMDEHEETDVDLGCVPLPLVQGFGPPWRRKAHRGSHPRFWVFLVGPTLTPLLETHAQETLLTLSLHSRDGIAIVRSGERERKEGSPRSTYGVYFVQSGLKRVRVKNPYYLVSFRPISLIKQGGRRDESARSLKHGTHQSRLTASQQVTP